MFFIKIYKILVLTSICLYFNLYGAVIERAPINEVKNPKENGEIKSTELIEKEKKSKKTEVKVTKKLKKKEDILSDKFKNWMIKLFLPDDNEDLQYSLTILDQKGKKKISINPDLKLNQASVSKLIVTLASLKYLGLNYRFKTQFYIKGEIDEDGVLDGDLIIKGLGDINVTTEDLYQIVENLKLRGLKRVKGKFILDISYFDNNYNIYEFKEEDNSKAYGAFNSALPLNYNAIKFSVAPGKKEGDLGVITLPFPIARMVVLENKLKTTKKWSRYRIRTSSAKYGKTKLKIYGRVNIEKDPYIFYRKVYNPDLYYGKTLNYLLRYFGIKITSRVKISRKDLIKDNDKVELFYEHKTRTLFDLLVMMNRYSNNAMAEQLLKIIGAEVSEKQGSWKEGIKAVDKMLIEDIGLKKGEFKYVNASGLNDANFFKTKQMAKILNYVYKKFDYKWYILSTLPKIGVSGTMKRYCLSDNCDGVIIAKTGSLRTTVALAGYIKGKKEVYSFSFSANFPASKKKFREMLNNTKQFFQEVIDSGDL